MARLTAVSGGGAKGPACFLLEAQGRRLLFDLGYGPQPGLWPDVSRVGKVDALLLSHAHRDHAGGLKLLPDVGNPPLYVSDPPAHLLILDASYGDYETSLAECARTLEERCLGRDVLMPVPPGGRAPEIAL